MIKSLKYSSDDEKFKKSWEYQQKRLNQEVSLLRERNRNLKVTLEEVRVINQEQHEEVAAARIALKEKEAVNQKLMKEVDANKEQIEQFDADKAKNAQIASTAKNGIKPEDVVAGFEGASE